MRLLPPLLLSLLRSLLPFTALATAAAADVVRLPCIADTSIVLLAGEERDHLGANPHIRIKGNQHLAAFAFDCAPLHGSTVTAAALHCHRGDAAIRAVTISTIQCPWDENGACGACAGMPGCDGWGVAGAWFPTVTQGNGNSLLCFAATRTATSPTPADPDWYVWPVAPELVTALATGCAFGLSVQEVDADYSRNPTVSAREQSGQQPYLEVTLGAAATPAATAAADLTCSEAIVAGEDAQHLFLNLHAPAAAFAWRIAIDGRALPAWDLPYATPSRDQSIPLHDLTQAAGDSASVEVTAIDGGGNAGPTRTLLITMPSPPTPSFPSIAAAPPEKPSLHPGVAIIPWLDKYRADGQPVGPLPADFRERNEVWSGQAILLSAAYGEVVGFQVLLTGSGTAAIAVTIPGCTATISRALDVDTPGGRIPDPLVPESTTPLDPNLATSFQVEIFVPFDDADADAIDGPKATTIGGALTITRTAGTPAAIPIDLRVHAFSLPRRASFDCELNGYGMPDALSTFYDLQQIAYDHRAHANILHYSHRTAAPGARKCNLDLVLPDGRRMDEARYNAVKPGDTHAFWDDFITAFGPYLSGSCFAHGHRGVVPAPGFYLTFHESWPLNVRGFCDPADPDAWTTFTAHPEYAQTFTAIMQDFIHTAVAQHWTHTGFQVFLNNKGAADDPKRSPWVLDEPASWWDYRALGYFAHLTHQAKGDHCPIDLDFRIDISRPEFARGCLDGAADLLVVGTGPFQQYHRLVIDHAHDSVPETVARLQQQRLWIYGGSNRVDASDRDTWGWAVEAFRDGATGVVPWQTIITGDAALTTGDELALFIIHERDGRTVVDRSRRLDAYLRAEEDIEYLVLLRDELHLGPAALAAFIDHYVDLSHTHHQDNDADAGHSQYPNLTPDACWRLRQAAAGLLDRPAP